MQALWRISHRRSAAAPSSSSSTKTRIQRVYAYHTHRTWDRPRRVYPGFAVDAACMCGAVVAYCSNNWVFKPNVHHTFFHSYFNDLFAMPFILGYSNLLIGCSRCRADLIRTPIRVSTLTLFCSLVWEGIAPLVIQRSCFDALDICSYCIGSFVYLLAIWTSGARGQSGPVTRGTNHPLLLAEDPLRFRQGLAQVLDFSQRVVEVEAGPRAGRDA